MAIYKTQDLLHKICEIIFDGYSFVDISELEKDDEFPTSLSFNACDRDCDIDYESVESCELPDDFYANNHIQEINVNDFCGEMPFTYKELFALGNSIQNALEYGKERLQAKDCSKEERDAIKSSSVELRNLQARFSIFFKSFDIH